MFDLSQFGAAEAARRLLGCEFERQIDSQYIRVRIVETEAYDQTDAASHSYKGRTPRTEVMFGRAKCLYVYFTYGMHYCCNIVVGPAGIGAGVLIRAAEPLEGDQFMYENRNGRAGIEVSNGPAKLCQALKIDRGLNGHDLNHSPLRLIERPEVPSSQVVSAKRIGIAKEVDKKWRFYIASSKYVSSIAR